MCAFVVFQPIQVGTGTSMPGKIPASYLKTCCVKQELRPSSIVSPRPPPTLPSNLKVHCTWHLFEDFEFKFENDRDQSIDTSTVVYRIVSIYIL